MKFKIIKNEQTPELEEIEDVDSFINENYRLMAKFISFARRQHNCTGLASNQVSMNGERILFPFFVMKYNNIWHIIINPCIIDFIGKEEPQIEGCLTWPLKKIAVKRYPCISVIYYDLNGELHKRNISGYEAQIFQHEYNHLKGVEEKFLLK